MSSVYLASCFSRTSCETSCIYSYQACEYEGWKASDAFRLVAFAKDSAVSELLRSLDLKTSWGLDEENSKRVEGISLADLSEG